MWWYYLVRTLKQVINRSIYLDLRSVALFRIALGVTILYDISDRIGDIRMHYSDEGVLPRACALGGSLDERAPFFSSILFSNGSTTFITLFFLAYAMTAFSLMMGFHSSVCCFLSLLMEHSVQHRNIGIGMGGDQYMRCSLFFALFLPLSDRFSVDNVINKYKRLRRGESWSTCNKNDNDYDTGGGVVTGMSAFAIMFQVWILYVSSVFHKSGDPWWKEHTAVEMALNLEFFCTGVCKTLLMLPAEFLQAMTACVIHWEWIAPSLLFLPSDWAKLVGTFGIIVLHFGFGISMRLGKFTFVTIGTSLVFLPSMFWGKLMFEWVRKRLCGSSLVHVGVSHLHEHPLLAITLIAAKEFALLPEATIYHLDNHCCNATGNSDNSGSGSNCCGGGDGGCCGGCHTTDGSCRGFGLISPSILKKCKRDIHYRKKEEQEEGKKQEERKEEEEDDTILVCVSGRGQWGTGGSALRLVVLGSPVVWWVAKLVPASSILFRLLFVLLTEDLTQNKEKKDIKYTGSDIRVKGRTRRYMGTVRGRRTGKMKHGWKVWRAMLHTGSNLLHTLFLVYVVICLTWWNLANLEWVGNVPENMLMFTMYTRLEQKWSMFSPHPPTESWYYTIKASLSNGTEVELLKDGGFYSMEASPFSFDMPKPLHHCFKNIRGYKQWETLKELIERNQTAGSEAYMTHIGYYVCREYNTKHPETRIKSFTLYWSWINTVLGGENTKGGTQQFWRHACYLDNNETLQEALD